MKINSEFDFEDFGYTNMIKEKDYISNVEEPLLEQTPQDPFYIVKSKISNTLMASFISGGSDSFNSSLKKDPNKEYHFNKNKIKEYMDIFRQHLSIKEHPINFVIMEFFNQFIPRIDDVIKLYKTDYKDKKLSCEEKALDIITQLQEFMVLIQIVIKIFYSRSISYAYFRDEKDEFLNLVSFIIFNNDKIYKKFFELFELMNKENEEILESKFNLLGDLTPEEIGIKPEFCLNQKTNELIEKLKEETKNLPKSEKDSDNNNNNNDRLTLNINGEEKIINDETDIDTIPVKENKEKEIQQSTNTINTNSSRLTMENFKITSDTGKLNIFTNDLFKNTVNFDSNEPYYEAILYIKKIKDFKVPLQKLIVVASLSNVITGCVNKFWKNMENIIKPEMLSIDSDELMTIFIYIIYKCKIPSIFVHADFINYFTTPTTKATMVWYYYITFRGCLDFLLNIKSKNDFIKESI
jgi:NADPH-dependent 7-cyano-7-deazaguanine reductase QueF